MSSKRDIYRNSCPPAGYIQREKPMLKLKDGLIKIDGIVCQFIKPMIEAGLFEVTEDLTKFVINPDSDDEVLEVPVQEKKHPVIELDDSPERISVTQTVHKAPTVQQVSTVSKNKEISAAEKKKENITRSNVVPVKKIIEEKVTSSTSPVKEVEQTTERKKVSPVQGRKSSPKKSSRKEASPKRRTSRKEKYDGYSSDDSVYSVHSKKKSPKEHRNRSCSPSRSRSGSSEDKKISIKHDPDNENLFGRYHCKVCKATMNSLATYETHLSGKRHLKNMKLRNVVDTVQKTIQPFQVDSKYPPPPPGIVRTKVRDTALIQEIIESSIRKPCPGLDNVIEIQGITETIYYCELCAAPCTTATIISHLTGFRHLLRCLKHFSYERYESVRDKKKFEVEKKLDRWLEDIEREYGRGRIVVEKEIRDEEFQQLVKTDPYGKPNVKFERVRREDIPGPSYRDPDDSFPEHYSKTTVPDTSKSDFYCRICDSHMNNINMWEMHVRGKRHLANVKKAPGELPSKSKTVLVPNVRANIMEEIDQVDEPIVGLNEMREVQNPEAPGEMYNCFLCGACLTRRDVIDHILTLKHRKKYLEKINHHDIATINAMNINETHMYSVIEETCFNVEAELGRGHMEVHVMKNAVSKW